MDGWVIGQFQHPVRIVPHLLYPIRDFRVKSADRPNNPTTLFILISLLPSECEAVY